MKPGTGPLRAPRPPPLRPYGQHTVCTAPIETPPSGMEGDWDVHAPVESCTSYRTLA